MRVHLKSARAASLLLGVGTLVVLGVSCQSRTFNPESEAKSKADADPAGAPFDLTGDALGQWYEKNGYTIVGPSTDALDMTSFTEWQEGENSPGDAEDRKQEIALESELWASVHDPKTMSINWWNDKAAKFVASKIQGDTRFPRLNVVQPFACLRSFADQYVNLIGTCIFEGKQSWFNERDGKIPSFALPMTRPEAGGRKISMNVNTWVMRYSMHSFEQMVKGQMREAAESLEYQLRIGVEGRASAAFSYALFRPHLKLRIRTADGRFLTPIERSLDILDNCDDKSTDYHDKTCRHTSPLAPHKYSGMLFALAEIQARAGAVLHRPEWRPEKLASEKTRHAQMSAASYARLESTETQAGMVENLDPIVVDFMKSKDVKVRPWPFASTRKKAMADFDAMAKKWNGRLQIAGLNYAGIIQLPMPEYAKGTACVGCHYQANENFEAGFKPHY